MKRFLDPTLAGTVTLLVCADWLSKLWISGQMALGESRSLVSGWLYLVHRENPGVAFSLFADLPSAIRTPVLGLISLVGVVLFARIVRDSSDGVVRLAAAAVIGGAIGNLGDRLLNGHVTDFVLISFFPFVFNLADAAITIGGLLLAARMIFSETAIEPLPAVDPE
ncbi:MAG TPA: signal peptidase II [Longimicrobiaceae bacterium]|nr:signal peptidase II [Longimicrobiaceae bacterium]